MTRIRDEIAADIPAREALLDRCLGERRTAKSSERLREGRLPAEGLALTAERDGEVLATVRLWHVEASGVPALLLGPLAVKPELQGEGLGKAMMREALAIHAADIGHVPLHQQVIPWAMRSNVSAFHRADNRLDVRWVRID